MSCRNYIALHIDTVVYTQIFPLVIPADPATVERDTETGTFAAPIFTTLSLVEPPSATM